MVHPKYPGETLFLKRHIYKSMTLNGRGCADCDEDHRRPSDRRICAHTGPSSMSANLVRRSKLVLFASVLPHSRPLNRESLGRFVGGKSVTTRVAKLNLFKFGNALGCFGEKNTVAINKDLFVRCTSRRKRIDWQALFLSLDTRVLQQRIRSE
jgi:hypothetical protein